MQRFILTGAPGAGKTALLRSLEADGYTVVEEAATDVITLDQARGVAKPWTEPSFPDRICQLQRARQTTASARPDTVQFYDRSPICTLALARHLGHQVPPALKRELDRIEAEQVYQRRVFFVELLGFITPSAARRIDLEEAIEFEALHRKTYRELGYDCVPIPPGTLPERTETIKHLIGGSGASTHLRDAP
ncbi:AAA family ATPase [Glycomyces tenuis]|uniref:AAA family ATPase n=1 Tax=Glycomyces tenuis TaxID=58116 RepID=UPI0004128180|nr:AAA family ATPase [Glycomyces tenuis]